jgi:hypothetical protein
MKTVVLEDLGLVQLKNTQTDLEPASKILEAF